MKISTVPQMPNRGIHIHGNIVSTDGDSIIIITMHEWPSRQKLPSPKPHQAQVGLRLVNRSLTDDPDNVEAMLRPPLHVRIAREHNRVLRRTRSSLHTTASDTNQRCATHCTSIRPTHHTVCRAASTATDRADRTRCSRAPAACPCRCAQHQPHPGVVVVYRCAHRDHPRHAECSHE